MPGRSGVVAPPCTSQAGDCTAETTLPAGGLTGAGAAVGTAGAMTGAGAAWTERLKTPASPKASANDMDLDMIGSLEALERSQGIIRRADISGCKAETPAIQGSRPVGPRGRAPRKPRSSPS